MVILVVAYLAMKSDKFGQTTGRSSNVAVETGISPDSTGYGAVQLIDHNDKEYYCDLVSADKCEYGYKDKVAMKLVAIPAEDSVFDGWVSGCDIVSTTNMDNDTCEINVYESKRTTEVRFVKI